MTSNGFTSITSIFGGSAIGSNSFVSALSFLISDLEDCYEFLLEMPPPKLISFEEDLNLL